MKEVVEDGFRVDYKIYMSVDGNTHIAQVKSLRTFLCSMADIVGSNKPDWIVVLAGDRGEQLMGAIARSVLLYHQ